QSGTYQVTFRVSDGSLSDEETISINVKDVVINNAPILDFIGDKNVSEGAVLEFMISATDIDGDVLTYSASGLPAGASFDANTRTFRWTPNYTQSGTYQVTFRVSDGSLSDEETISINVIDFDDGSPRYFNIIEKPSNPATYAPNQVYIFGIDWHDLDGVDSAWIIFNGVKYSSVMSGGYYYFEISDLKAGTYNYEWHANDTKGNENVVTRSFVINKAIPVLSLSVRPDKTVEEGVTTTIEGKGCPNGLICTLYRNGENVTNPDVAKLKKGEYVYVYNTTGNENYTFASTTTKLIVIEESDSGGGKGGKREIYDVDENSLNNGYSRWLDVGDMLRFKICDGNYFIKLSDLTSAKATIKIMPNQITDVFKESESKSYDLHGDAIKDIIIKIEKIDYGNRRAKIFIMKLSTSVCKTISSDKTQTQGDDLIILNEKAIVKQKKSLLEYLIFGLLAGIIFEIVIVLIVTIARAISVDKK
ncbi:MAG: Ig domain-containing protein, partial [Candidatus Pacearchaeota archaeon]|nr:Ig domain-containing protein [Candidatus Pacearchaeota archaeon]